MDMRTIKFRGKAVFNGTTGSDRWIESGVFFKQPNERWMIHGVQVQPETVGQYTGLNDKNGKEIYEGDIIRLGYNFEKQFIAYVKWSRDHYELCKNKVELFNMSGPSTDAMCVIGNIYDNPEKLSEPIE